MSGCRSSGFFLLTCRLVLQLTKLLAAYTKFLMERLRTSLLSLESARTRSELLRRHLMGTETNGHRYAMDIVRECGEAWEKLITGKTQQGGIAT